MAQKQVYVFKTADAGQKLEVNVFHSGKQNTSNKKPIAVYFHGGSFIVGSKEMLAAHYIDKLLELGFGAVVSPDYRLSPTIPAYEGGVTDSLDAYQWAYTELPDLLAKDAGVQLDGDSLVTFGHSIGGTLALLAAGTAKPPRAILDLFGMIYLKNPAYSTPSPLPVPEPDHALVEEIKKQVPPPVAAPPPFGPNGFNTSTPRNAWFVSNLKKGTLLSAAVQDGNFDRIDPTNLFSSSFPPTYFIHGTADNAVPAKLSEKAHQELKAKGVKSEYVELEGAPHGFDAQKTPESPEVALVLKGLEFLKANI